MRRLLARVIEAMARYGDPIACRFANDTDEAAPSWDDYGYTPDTDDEERP